MLCHHRAGVVGAGERVQMGCSEPASARYVSIQKPDNTALQLCEVQVYTDIGETKRLHLKVQKVIIVREWLDIKLKTSYYAGVKETP